MTNQNSLALLKNQSQGQTVVLSKTVRMLVFPKKLPDKSASDAYFLACIGDCLVGTVYLFPDKQNRCGESQRERWDCYEGIEGEIPHRRYFPERDAAFGLASLASMSNFIFFSADSERVAAWWKATVGENE